MINIVIADDHALVREGLKRTLRKNSTDIDVINEAGNAAELMDVLNEELPDLLILDITMPGKNGLDALKELKQFYPNLPVLILSMHPEERYAIRALKAGAFGYLTKSSIPDELVKAIKRVVTDKKKYISSSVAEQLAQNVGMDVNKSLHETLSDREFQVMRMIASGKKVKEIADDLSLSVRTVHTYRARVLDKMKLKSNVELTRYAIENNLVE